MKITVCGGANNKEYTAHQIRECEKLGEFLAKIKAHVCTGACPGFPYYVGKAAIKHGAHVTGFSPALSKDEHAKEFGYPTDAVTDFIFPSKKYGTKSECFFRREVEMISVSDIVVAMGGSWGTFGEIMIAFNLKKPLILVEEFEGAVSAFDDVYAYFSAREVNPAVHNGSPIIRVKTVDDATREIVNLKR